MLTVVLTRHGATDRSDPEQHLGRRIDIGLSEAGRAAAEALAARLAVVAFDRIVSSPLRRALETARIVAGEGPSGDTGAAAEVETDARLAEMDYGVWEGLTYAEIDARDAGYRRRWEADPGKLACPNGESGEDVARRVRSLLDEALAPADEPVAATHAKAGTLAEVATPGETPDGRILLVAHSTVNRILLAVALGIPVRDYRRRFRQDPANLTVLRFPGSLAEGAQLVVANDTSHLSGAGAAPWR